MAKLAMVILNYNDYEITYEYVKRIEQYGTLDRIVIVDNNSSDGSYEKLYKNCQTSKIEVLRAKENGGYAKGNNVGLRYLSSCKEKYDYVIISNPDIVVEESTIRRLLNVIESRKDCFAITGEVFTSDGKRIAGFRSKLPTICQIFIESSVILRKSLWVLFKYGRQYKNDQVEREGTLYKSESLPGCFFLANLNKFKSLGFFDEQTFLYAEEDILFSKAKASGLKFYVVPGTKIVHAEGTTIKKNLTGWISRERIREQSNIVYMNTCLNASGWITKAYIFWNRLFIVGRYLNMKLRTKYY